MARINSKNRARLAERLASRKGCGWWCFYCRAPFTENRRPTFDHYIPYSAWKTGRQWNLVLACSSCNTAKADRLPYTVAVVLLCKVRTSPVWRAACQGGGRHGTA
ncbi:HNH endonuclease [Streptomyces sp. NBC_01142]|uniref:HNH endonuclease n=1 Tax=Streptomyces sp. NBC_01142 TaxID=2975865 RepID=UPI002259B01D|nr:HNH endonuclease [Streptomyces sp. NBC_01142]MCX4824867.1 HNH endonuclease [Streptomyces sp. NBC_01142]